jgi:nucleotide-binding universal stress UspA family protein
VSVIPPSRPALRPPLDVHRILVPTDFSETSDAAYEVAIELGARFAAELVLVHVHQVPAYVFPEGVMPLSPALFDEIERSVRAELERSARRARAAGRTVTLKSRIGVVHREILREAEDSRVDLVVMGTHGRTGLGHVLIGSVAEKVLRRAPCPVLTVGPHRREPIGPPAAQHA